MATGRHLQLTKQAGEYLVAAELCRRGLISTTFTGNVPHYDIIASDETGKHVPIQVKTLASGSWQLDIRNFAEVELRDGKQYVGKPINLGIPNLVCVFLELSTYGRDCFHVLKWSKLQSIVLRDYRRYLKKHGGARARKADSFHCIVTPSQLAKCIDSWDVVTEALKRA